MKLNSRKINILLILIFFGCVLLTVYTLFQLGDDMINSSHVLSISHIDAAAPAFTKLYLVVGITLLVGISTVVYLFRNREQNIIYVEKEKDISKTAENDIDEDDSENNHLNISFINEILKSESQEQKILDKALTGICKKLDAGIGVIYKYKATKDDKRLEMMSSFALSLGESQTLSFELGEGLVGQVAKEKSSLLVDDIPDGYIKIISGLGTGSPTNLLLQAIEYDQKLYGVIEIAGFNTLDKQHVSFVKRSMEKIMGHLNKKSATSTDTSKSKKVLDQKSSKEKTKKA